MTGGWRVVSWTVLFALGLAVLWVLQPVLLPFVAGLIVAYLLDPPVRRLAAWGCSRTLATSLVSGLFFLSLAAATALLAPILQRQLVGLVQQLVNVGPRCKNPTGAHPRWCCSAAA